MRQEAVRPFRARTNDSTVTRGGAAAAALATGYLLVAPSARRLGFFK
ncbi:MAG: hypothetical protein WKF84_23865 [Pyrinomonadaceae bacterium]